MQSASRAPANSAGTPRPIDWRALEAAAAGSSSLEQAIGRVIARADQMCREVFDAPDSTVRTSTTMVVEPFFAFSVADVMPDFGDDSRYRTKVTRWISGVLKARASADGLPADEVKR